MNYGVTDEASARLAWARLSEPADSVAVALIERFGFHDAFHIAARGGTAPNGKVVDRFTARLKDLHLDRDREICERLGARQLLPGDPEWPTALDDLAVPPWCLWVRGPVDLAAVPSRSVAVVGARTSTAYGNHVAAEIGAGTGARGFTVVSGAAFGIDAAAHRGALSVEAPTVAVLACGVDRVYPAAHADLIAAVSRAGGVLTEVPPGSAPTRPRFLARNRIIAALATGTVVVEAGLRSGSLNTLRAAAAIGRPVAVVPGPVTSMVSAGCHRAVREEGAVLVTDAAEVVDLLGDIGGDDLAPAKRGPERVQDQLDDLPLRVWSTLAPFRSKTVEEITVQAGLAAAEVLGALGELQGRGLAELRLDGWGRV
ncbi:DNA-processing protein DprA [Ornithinimicrobium sp. F0845]|uniref:DNA-processing protein DprA n=1 Tax=Ornithinimicrobium sp. F0845 TaxID=2926412 RepID=UPI001FF48AFB|nr:DNA-processing protein DprA [Ornithinimicrobium sp. F0845]MCK0111288.1 DNA-processing protein DprA [Ornithinimicrobium sp. F0845]